MNNNLSSLTLPYPGLRPFEESDGPIFFGRQTQVAALLRQLERHRFVAVVGSSGSGKSSLVRAGLLPAIKRGFLMETTQWLPIVIRPGRDPYRNLADELFTCSSTIHNRPIESEFDVMLRKTLRLTDSGLTKVLPNLNFPHDTHFLLIVDQFEELFSFRISKGDSDDYTSRNDASAFVNMLLHAFQQSNANIWIVITMRSDFIGHCEAFLDLPQYVSQSQFLVPRLDSNQMEEAIVRPSLLTGAAFDPFTVPGELVNLVINEAGDRPDQLPLMQHALMRTWKNAVADAKKAQSPVLLTVKNYDDAGRMKDSLNRDADEAWRTLKEDSRLSSIGRQMLLLLCDVLPGGRIVRRRPFIKDVMAVTGATQNEISTILNIFQKDDRNFILPVANTALDVNAPLDIMHESLFRQWHKVQQWIQRESESAANYRDLIRGSARLEEEPGYRLNKSDTRRLLAWKASYIPTEAWAARYGGDFRGAMVFLDKCRRHLTRKRRIVATSLAAAISAICICGTFLLHHDWSVLKLANAQLQEQKERSEQSRSAAVKRLASLDATSRFHALRLATRSLRAYQNNSAALDLLGELIMENRWCAPASPALASDVVDKYVLAATFITNLNAFVFVTQEGALLIWKGAVDLDGQPKFDKELLSLQRDDSHWSVEVQIGESPKKR